MQLWIRVKLSCFLPQCPNQAATTMTRGLLLAYTAYFMSLSCHHCYWASRVDKNLALGTVAGSSQKAGDESEYAPRSVELNMEESISNQFTEIPAAWALPGKEPGLAASESAPITGTWCEFYVIL